MSPTAPPAVAPALYPSQGGVSKQPAGWIAHYRRRKGPSGYSSSATAEQVAASWSGEINGNPKVVIVTGGSGGIGLESAAVLAGKGADVILAVRSQQKGDAAVAEIQKRKPGAKVSVMLLDLSSLKSVREFAAAFKATGKGLHVLLLNAGVMWCPFELSADGHEMQFATNHLGHWLLTQLLLDVMLDTAEKSGIKGRVISVSSMAHHIPACPEGGIDFDKLGSPDGYDAGRAYGRSKLCNVLFARKLAELMEGKPILAVSCHPGAIMGTDLSRHLPAFARSSVAKMLMSWAVKSIPQGAATQVYLATADDVIGGEYYQDCNVAHSTEDAHSKELAQKLWEVSEQMCKE